MRQQVNTQLIAQYRQWLEDVKAVAPALLGEKYSNPYFSSIPESWFQTEGPRIMVVGEEGFGTWGCGKGDGSIAVDEIEKIQMLNFDYLNKQLITRPSCEVNNSAFWRRFRKIAGYGVCCWTNIDKIHILDKKNCALSEIERNRLHAVDTRILYEEISILKPTHIVFFGWHGTSLKHELPEIHSILYPGGPKDKSVWDKTAVSFEYNNQTYLFCYHPNWGYRTAGYEDKVIKQFEECVKELV